MARFDYNRTFSVGDQRAENDWHSLKDNFVEINVSRVLGSEEPTIILGRKGAGKSALRLHFEKNTGPRQRAFSLQPSYRDLKGVFTYVVDVENSGFSVEFVSQIWELAALINLVVSVSKDQRVPFPPQDFKKLPKELHADLIAGERYGLGRTLSVIRRYMPSEDSRYRVIRTLRSYLKQAIPDTGFSYFIVIDSVDDLLHNSLDTSSRNDLFATFFEGLLTFFRDFSNKERNSLAEQVYINILIPLDIFNWAVDRNADHIRQYKHEVRWTATELNEFITTRLLRNLPPTSQSKIMQVPNFEERTSQIWDAFFPKHLSVLAYLPNQAVRFDIETRREFINLTLRRPRDLQEIVRLVAKYTKEAKLSFPTTYVIRDAINQYSIELRQSVEKEYEVAFPNMHHILNSFSGNLPNFSKNNLLEIIGSVVGRDASMIDRAMHLLYEACVLGAVQDKYRGNESATFYYDFENFNALSHCREFVIHRAFWHSLRLHTLQASRSDAAR